MKVSELLKSVNNYPIPANVIMEAGIRHGISPDDEADKEVLASEAYNLAKADIYEYLAGAPNVSQNGISFTFTDEQRSYFLSMASSIRREWGVTDLASGQGYGYMGEDL